MTDGLGQTTGGGKNTAADIVSAMAQSGETLPQVTDGGLISGTWHTVTSDGAGPIAAVLDSTGTGAFASGVMLETVTQIPGNKGNIRPQKRSLWERAVSTISKRAVNINTDEVCLSSSLPFSKTAMLTHSLAANGIQGPSWYHLHRCYGRSDRSLPREDCQFQQCRSFRWCHRCANGRCRRCCCQPNRRRHHCQIYQVYSQQQALLRIDLTMVLTLESGFLLDS